MFKNNRMNPGFDVIKVSCALSEGRVEDANRYMSQYDGASDNSGLANSNYQPSHPVSYAPSSSDEYRGTTNNYIPMGYYPIDTPSIAIFQALQQGNIEEANRLIHSGILVNGYLDRYNLLDYAIQHGGNCNTLAMLLDRDLRPYHSSLSFLIKHGKFCEIQCMVEHPKNFTRSKGRFYGWEYEWYIDNLSMDERTNTLLMSAQTFPKESKDSKLRACSTFTNVLVSEERKLLYKRIDTKISAAAKSGCKQVSWCTVSSPKQNGTFISEVDGSLDKEAMDMLQDHGYMTKPSVAGSTSLYGGGQSRYQIISFVKDGISTGNLIISSAEAYELAEKANNPEL